jgi:hypothetical protein
MPRHPLTMPLDPLTMPLDPLTATRSRVPEGHTR